MEYSYIRHNHFDSLVCDANETYDLVTKTRRNCRKHPTNVFVTNDLHFFFSCKEHVALTEERIKQGYPKKALTREYFALLNKVEE